MAIERLWEHIPARQFTADGTDDGIITINTVCNFRVKQVVKISALGQPTITAQIKRVTSITTFVVGPIDQNLHTRLDLSVYTVANIATVEAAEQNKTGIPHKDQLHMTLEREPVNARRVFPVDCVGDGYTTDNPFPVQLPPGAITANIDLPNAEGLTVLNIATKGTEESFTFPDRTQFYQIRARKAKDIIRVGLATGDINNGNYWSIDFGNIYSPEVQNDFPNGYTLYFESKNKDNVDLEIRYWYFS